MLQSIPIRDLMNTADISELCRTKKEPIYITKDGQGDMVIMSVETFEKTIFLQEVYRKIEAGQKDFESGRTKDAFQSLESLRVKHGI